MRCPECGNINDNDAKFCDKCGADLRRTLTESMPTITKMLIIIVIILVAAIGVVSGMMLINNQAKPISNSTINNSTDNISNTPSQSTQSSSQYKTFSNNAISFQYPSGWDVLPNGANTMVIVGGSDYPHFSVYDESKYGHTSLADYVASSKKGMKEDGFTVRSERSITVDGLPAYEIIFQGETKILHMALVEKSLGSQYFALEGADYVNHYEQEVNTFNQIIKSFKFLS